MIVFFSVAYNIDNTIAWVSNFRWNLAFKSWNIARAESLYGNAYSYKASESDNILFNEALVKYRKWEYEKAIKILNNIESEPLGYELNYNIWNTYYKIWENTSDQKAKSSSWKRALNWYENALSYKYTVEAKENYDFVQSKLNELNWDDSPESQSGSGSENSQQWQESGSGSQNDQNDSQQSGQDWESSQQKWSWSQQSTEKWQEGGSGSQNMQSGSWSQDSQQWQESAQTWENWQQNWSWSQQSTERWQESGSGTDSSSEQNTANWATQSGGSQDQKSTQTQKQSSFSQAEQNEINNYMNKLDEFQKSNQQHFKRWEVKQDDNNPFANPFWDDPFFREFFWWNKKDANVRDW